MFSLLCLPVGVVIAALIAADSRGPIFFADERLGRHSRSFRCYKFRTMHINGDEILARYLEHNEEAAQSWRVYRKLKGHDPRLTRLGAFLRRWSLDELPQFINVIKGEMSLVGPRPFTHGESQSRGEALPVILSVRPGVSGMWQVNGRDHCTLADRVHCDVEYVRNQSLLLDFQILAKTFEAVLRHGLTQSLPELPQLGAPDPVHYLGISRG
jgi:undecaprenyl-phosphate galactose phosphotransferase